MKSFLICLAILLLSGPADAGGEWTLGVQWHNGYYSGHSSLRPTWRHGGFYGGRYRYDPFWGRYDPWFDRYRHDHYRDHRYRRPRPYIIPAPPRIRVIPPPVTLRQEQVSVGSRATLPANARTRVGPTGVVHEWQGVCYRLDWEQERYRVTECPE